MKILDLKAERRALRSAYLVIGDHEDALLETEFYRTSTKSETLLLCRRAMLDTIEETMETIRSRMTIVSKSIKEIEAHDNDEPLVLSGRMKQIDIDPGAWTLSGTSEEESTKC